MKEVISRAAQGDVLLIKVAEMPMGLRENIRKPGEPVVVAHSETGHHHSIHDDGVRGFDDPTDPLICYLRVEGESFNLVHHRPYDTHETLKFLGSPGSIWKVHKQREHSPEGWRRVQD